MAAGLCGAPVEMRADLLEFVGACGFKTWQNSANPCFCCMAPHDDLWNFPPSFAANAWPDRDRAAYSEQVRRATQKRVVSTEEQMAELLRRLTLDGRANGWPGLVLMRDFPEMELERGFRVIEAGRVVDIWALGDLALPVELSFFDCKGEHGLNLICPLFDVRGFSIEMLALDVMHIIDLGIAQYLVGAVFRQLVDNNFCRSDMVYREANRQINVRHLRRRIAAYYISLHRARGTMFAIGNLSLAQIGPVAKPRLSAKAAEARMLSIARAAAQ